MTHDEIQRAQLLGRRIEACPETGCCHCPCHTDEDAFHLVPCCTPCAGCGMRVMIGHEELHDAVCETPARSAPQCCPETGACQCRCHYGKPSRCQPGDCCEPCEKCNVRVAFGSEDLHAERCGK